MMQTSIWAHAADFVTDSGNSGTCRHPVRDADWQTKHPKREKRRRREKGKEAGPVRLCGARSAAVVNGWLTLVSSLHRRPASIAINWQVIEVYVMSESVEG